MRYRMIGIDIDGTLLDRQSRISDANRAAIRAAQEQGVMIVPCTGRAWHESTAIIRDIEGLDTGVFVTGSAINDVSTGDLIEDFPLDPDIAHEVTTLLLGGPEAVLLFREISKAGHHYLVTGGELKPNTNWWFQRTDAVVLEHDDPDFDHFHHTLRVALVAHGDRALDAEQKVRETYGDKVTVHAFEAIQRPDDEQNIHILEIFRSGVDKWCGLTWVAEQNGVAKSEIAVIGDEINDVSMLSAAGCGIAMENAVPSARAAADYVTRHHDESGVAYAIEQLLSENWG